MKHKQREDPNIHVDFIDINSNQSTIEHLFGIFNLTKSAILCVMITFVRK